MLARTVLSYAPSNLLPAATALAIVVLFTRLLPPREFGQFAVAQAAVLMLQAFAFQGIQLAVTRMSAAHQASGTLPKLLGTSYTAYSVVAVLIIVLTAAALNAANLDPALVAIFWAALPLLLFRGLVGINLAVHRGTLSVGRHNLVEGTQSLGGLACAIFFAMGLDLGATGLVLGLACGSFVAAALDSGLVLRHAASPDREVLRRVAAFAGPLVVCYALAASLAYADRVFLERLAGAEATALYAVAFALVDRPIALLFMAVTLAAFPLAVRELELEGQVAARTQLLKSASLLLALVVPAAVGIACLAAPIATVLVGADYREGVIRLLPWLALLGLLRGFGAHYLDHALHLANRTGLFLWTLGPPALVSFGLNFLLIPQLGLTGALVTALAAQALVLFLTTVIGRHVFPIAFPWRQAAKASLAALIMGFALWLWGCPATIVGLMRAIVGGALVYGATAALLDVADLRTLLVAWLRTRTYSDDRSAGELPRPFRLLISRFATINAFSGRLQTPCPSNRAAAGRGEPAGSTAISAF